MSGPRPAGWRDDEVSTRLVLLTGMMTMPPSSLSDAVLLEEAVRAAGSERRATADVVALLAEVDSRGLYFGQGYPSLFA